MKKHVVCVVLFSQVASLLPATAVAQQRPQTAASDPCLILAETYTAEDEAWMARCYAEQREHIRRTIASLEQPAAGQPAPAQPPRRRRGREIPVRAVAPAAPAPVPAPPPPPTVSVGSGVEVPLSQPPMRRWPLPRQATGPVPPLPSLAPRYAPTPAPRQAVAQPTAAPAPQAPAQPAPQAVAPPAPPRRAYSQEYVPVMSRPSGMCQGRPPSGLRGAILANIGGPAPEIPANYRVIQSPDDAASAQIDLGLWEYGPDPGSQVFSFAVQLRINGRPIVLMDGGRPRWACTDQGWSSLLERGETAFVPIPSPRHVGRGAPSLHQRGELTFGVYRRFPGEPYRREIGDDGYPLTGRVRHNGRPGLTRLRRQHVANWPR